MSLVEVEGGEALEHFGDVHVVDLVDLLKILEDHEDDIGEQSGLLAEVRVLENVEDLSHERLKHLVVLQDLGIGKSPHMV